MSASWAGTPVDPNDPIAQAQAQAAIAAAQNAQQPALPSWVSSGATRNVPDPPFVPPESEGWTRTGGNHSSSFYTNSKTGEVREIRTSDGSIEKSWTADEWKQQAEDDSTAGQIKAAARDLAGQLPKDPLGTPGISGSDNPVDLLDAIKKTGQNNTLVNIDPNTGLSLGGGLGGGGLVGNSQIMDPIQAALARQAAIADQQGAAAANYQPVAAPTVAGPGQIYAEFAQHQDPIQAALAQAQSAQAAQVGQTALTPQQQAIQAQQIQAAQIAQQQQAQVGQISPTQVGPTTLANASQIDLAQQAQMRQAQQGLIGGLQGAISGAEPSVAAIMLRNATDRNVANQYALAQAANGMNTGLAQRTAMINASEMNQNAVMQQALLRAQEITAARGQLGGVLDSARGADIGLATNQAGFQQQAGLANAGALNTSTLTQAQLAQQAAIQQAQLQQGASQFNAGQYNDAATQQAQLAQQAALANQSTGLQAGTTNATLAQQAALANTAAQNQTYQTNANLQQGAALQNAQLGTQASIANAGNVTGANTASAQLSNAVNLANANNQSQANITGAQLGTQAAIASGNNQVSTNALNQKAVNDAYQNQLTAAGQAGQTAVGAGNVAANLAEAEAKKQAALIGGISAGAAALISDRRQKTDVTKAEAEIAEFTSKLNPYAFRYKDPGKPGTAPGKRFGIMAQDLEKSAIGRSLVREVDGTKQIDVPQSIGAILATLSAMNKRIEAR